MHAKRRLSAFANIRARRNAKCITVLRCANVRTECARLFNTGRLQILGWFRVARRSAARAPMPEERSAGITGRQGQCRFSSSAVTERHALRRYSKPCFTTSTTL